ncbi:MarR family transcriptional regulator [Desulfitobacterium sp. THU1]|uniref:MarR family winged helix-turn-helix transcriptional regulator n=1 Tax=Desulfitobacterium sp. THU1 TaxID=3138072 RepID=UPI00311FABD5
MLYKTEDKLDLALLIALSRATQAVHRRSAVIFKEGDMTLAQFAVLEALYHKGDMTIYQIIESVLSTSGNMTVIINNLEKENLIQRHANPKDKRSFLIAITEKGKDKIETTFPKHLQDLKNCFSIYTEEEKDQLVSLLRKIV